MDKTLNLLGLCRRAGKLVMGNDMVQEEVRAGRASLVIMTADISKNTAKKQTAVCSEHGVLTLRLNRSREELGCAVGKFCAVVAVCDRGFAEKLTELIKLENQEENVYD